MTQTIIERLASILSATPDRAGRWHADCPMCGAAGLHGNRPAYHFYFYSSEARSGATCWSCGYRATLNGLLRDVGDDGTYAAPQQKEVPANAPPPWQRPGAWQNWQRAMSPKQDAIWQTWQAYRPFTRETIARAGLAVERLVFHNEERGWYHARHPRLLMPIVRNDVMIGIRGRAYQPLDDGPKWLSATGTQTWLMGLEHVQRGKEVIWCESLADRLLGEQQHPGVSFIASGGLTWRDEWLDQLRAARPAHVLVWFDHDLSGNGSMYHDGEWLDQWRADIARRRSIDPRMRARPMPAAPEPRGPRLVAELRKRGIHAELYQWHGDSHEHADMGWALMENMRREQAE